MAGGLRDDLWYVMFHFFCFSDVPEMMAFLANPIGCFAALSWSNPTQTNCPITRYTVHFRETATISNENTKWQTKNLGKLNKTEYRLQLNCNRTYEVMVIAWNERGSSIPDANLVTVRTETGIGIFCYIHSVYIQITPKLTLLGFI